MTKRLRSLGVLLPPFLLLVMAMLPLVSGARTLFLRDAFALHLPLKAAQARILNSEPGGLLPTAPLVAPEVAGGQPLVGNLNAVPLYPDNLLYLVTPLLWAFNAHFWIHFLLAPLAMFWLAREWGADHRGAAAAGVAFGASGYLVSQLNLYNLVAGVALAPALAAAALRLTKPQEPQRWGWLLATTLLWTLEILAGDPMIAAQAALLAVTAVAVRIWGEGRAALLKTALAPLAAFGLGTLLAAPQWIETARILPLSYRGHQGYSATTAGLASFDPRQVLEWLLPMAFGRPDLLREGAFWGAAYYDGLMPFYFTLYPGMVVLVLVAVSGLHTTRRRLWAWGMVILGMFLALGAWNPLMRPLLDWGGGLVRYPIKFWLLLAVGTALLAGLGFERIFREDGETLRRWVSWGFVGLAGCYAFIAGMMALFTAGAAGVLTNAGVPSPRAPAEVDRWLVLASLTAAVLAAAWLVLRLGAKRPPAAAALLLALHAASQLLFLRPAMPTDGTAFYRQPPPALRTLPPDAKVVFGAGPGAIRPYRIGDRAYPEPRTLWGIRGLVTELSPTAGALFGRRYELNVSAEGLSSFLTHAARQALEVVEERQRLRLLAAWGVNRLVLPGPLTLTEEEAATEKVRRLAPTTPGLPGGGAWVYEIENAAPEVTFAHRLIFAPHMNAALGTLAGPAFHPATDVVLPGQKAPRQGRPGEVLNTTVTRETLEVEVTSPDGGALVWQRAHLGIYRASVDGLEVGVEIANLHRIGVPVPPGDHQVRVWVDRRSLSWGFVLSLLGAAGLVVARRWFRQR